MRILALQTILVAVDVGDDAGSVIETAHHLARASGAILHVSHIKKNHSAAVASGAASLSSDALREWLTGLVREVGGDPQGNDPEVTVHVIDGEGAAAIGQLAERLRADVIVLGPHRVRDRTGQDHLLGHTAMGVVTDAAVPCLLAMGPLRLPLQQVLVPIDISDAARGALMVALSWGSALRAHGQPNESGPSTTLTVTHVGARSRIFDDELDAIRRDAGSWANVAIEDRIIDGTDVPQAVAAQTSEIGAQLIVLGTRGLGSDPVGRLSSVSAAIAGLVHVPVLLVPPVVWATAASARALEV